MEYDERMEKWNDRKYFIFSPFYLVESGKVKENNIPKKEEAMLLPKRKKRQQPRKKKKAMVLKIKRKKKTKNKTKQHKK